ncbi:hypothetical protein KEM55_000983 [Ascosphaera atra]|nr:hypothetical protein KEM55_000983 [Ascosphaera atra]
MLASSTSEAGQMMDRSIETTSLRQGTNRSRHRLIGDGKETNSDLLGGKLVPSIGTLLSIDLLRKLSKLLPASLNIERLVLVGAKDLREVLRK